MARLSKEVLPRSPHFFKIFFPQLSGEKLGIPPNFWRHINNRTTTRVVSLKGPSGNVWTADLVRNADGISIQNGWPEFVRDNSIMLHDFLLFRYNGYSQFTVFIFGKNACEKEDAFLASSCQELAIIGDSSIKRKTLVNLVDDVWDPAPCERFQDLPESDHVHLTAEAAYKSPDNKVHYTNDSDHQDRLRSNGDVPMPFAENNEVLAVVDLAEPAISSDENELVRCNYTKRKLNSCERSGKKQCNEGKLSSMQVSSELHISAAKRQLHATNGIHQPVSVIKEEPIELIEVLNQKENTHPSDKNILSPSDKKRKHTSRKPPESKCSLKKPITSTKKTGKECHIYAVRSKERWHKLNNERREVIVKARMGTLVSNRRPVSEEEVTKAREAAQLFRPKNPAALVVMQESYVYYGFYLNLPQSFVRDYLPKSTQGIKLWDPNGNAWAVNYVVYLGRGGISAKWGAFALANNLEKDDVCIFELIDKEELKVHIFRVVDELTPPTRMPSRCKEEHPLLMLEGSRKVA